MLHCSIVKIVLQKLVQPEITRSPSILEVKLPNTSHNLLACLILHKHNVRETPASRPARDSIELLASTISIPHKAAF